MAMHLKRMLSAPVIAALAVAAHAKDRAIHVASHDEIVLTQTACKAKGILGAGWHRSFEQIRSGARTIRANASCWRRVRDEIYVLQLPQALLDLSGNPGKSGGVFQRLLPDPCYFNAPGVSFAGWHDGRTVALGGIPQGGVGKAVVMDLGPMCWRWTKAGAETIGEPGVYSAQDVRSAVAP